MAGKHESSCAGPLSASDRCQLPRGRDRRRISGALGAQQVAAGNGGESQSSMEIDEPQGVMRSPAVQCDILHKNLVAAVGFEHPSDSPKKTTLSEQRGAESGALALVDPALSSIVTAWPTLSEPIQRAILAMVGSQMGTNTR